VPRTVKLHVSALRFFFVTTLKRPRREDQELRKEPSDEDATPAHPCNGHGCKPLVTGGPS